MPQHGQRGVEREINDREGQREPTLAPDQTYAQLFDEPISSGAEAATAGVCDTATNAPDFTPLGMLTERWSVGIATM